MFEVHAHVSMTSVSVDSFIHIVMVFREVANKKNSPRYLLVTLGSHCIISYTYVYEMFVFSKEDQG